MTFFISVYSLSNTMIREPLKQAKRMDEKSLNALSLEQMKHFLLGVYSVFLPTSSELKKRKRVHLSRYKNVQAKE